MSSYVRSYGKLNHLTHTIQKYTLLSDLNNYVVVHIITHLLVESVMIPVDLFLPPTIIAGLSDDGTFNVK